MRPDREAELLEANNRYLERARAGERLAEAYRAALVRLDRMCRTQPVVPLGVVELVQDSLTLEIDGEPAADRGDTYGLIAWLRVEAALAKNGRIVTDPEALLMAAATIETLIEARADG